MKMLEDRANGEGLLCLSDDELRSVRRNSSISDVYDVEDTVFARGKFATVRRANHKTTGVQYAAKYIKKRRRAVDMTPEIYHEISVLRKCAPCGRVVRLHEVYETNSDVVLVLELAAGGELQRIFDTDHCLNEVEARRAMRQILEGLGYLHERNIAHLDLKPQNLLLTVEDSCDDIKLCDFGVSRLLAPGAEVRALLGTPDYVAPEVLSYEPISLATDIWSVGVLAYVLLSGYTPFGGDTKQQTYLNISQCILTFEPDHFGDVSTAAIEFIKSSLLVNPRLRPTVQDLLQHPWISPKSHILPSLTIKTTEPIGTTPKTTPISQHLNNTDEEASSSNLIDELETENSESELIIVDVAKLGIRRRSNTTDQAIIIDEILKSDVILERNDKSNNNSKPFGTPPNSLIFLGEQPSHNIFSQPELYISPEFEAVEEFTRPISTLDISDVIEPNMNGADNVDICLGTGSVEKEFSENMTTGKDENDLINTCIENEETIPLNDEGELKNSSQSIVNIVSSIDEVEEVIQNNEERLCTEHSSEEATPKTEINIQDDDACLSNKNNEHNKIDDIVFESSQCLQIEHKLGEEISTEIVSEDVEEENNPPVDENNLKNSSESNINDASSIENVEEFIQMDEPEHSCEEATPKVEINIQDDEACLSNKNNELEAEMKNSESINDVSSIENVEEFIQIDETEHSTETLNVHEDDKAFRNSSEINDNTSKCSQIEHKLEKVVTTKIVTEEFEENNQKIDDDKLEKLSEETNFLLSIGCSEIKYQIEEVTNTEIVHQHFKNGSHEENIETNDNNEDNTTRSDEDVIKENRMSLETDPTSSNLNDLDNENGDLKQKPQSSCDSLNNQSVDENANWKMKIESEENSIIEIENPDVITEDDCRDVNSPTSNHHGTSKESLDLGFDEDSIETDEDEGRFAVDSYLWEQNQPSKSFGSALSKFKAIEEQTKNVRKTRQVVRRKKYMHFSSSHVEETKELKRFSSSVTSDLELSPEVCEKQSKENLHG